MRTVFPTEKIENGARTAIEGFHKDIVREIQEVIGQNDWVIVGMAQNPVVKSARKYMIEKKMKFHYIEHGSYLSKWKERLAIKMWSGWPTFPQIFHKGRLVGGFSDLKAYLERG